MEVQDILIIRGRVEVPNFYIKWAGDYKSISKYIS